MRLAFLPRDAPQSAVMRLHIVRLSVCLSVTLRYDFHTGWNTSKINWRPNSLRLLLWLTPTWAIWCNGNTPKIRVEYGWGEEHIKRALAQKRCKIGPKLLLRTNRKSAQRFRLAPISVTLDALERRKRPPRQSEQKFWRPAEKFQRR